VKEAVDDLKLHPPLEKGIPFCESDSIPQVTASLIKKPTLVLTNSGRVLMIRAFTAIVLLILATSIFYLVMIKGASAPPVKSVLAPTLAPVSASAPTPSASIAAKAPDELPAAAPQQPESIQESYLTVTVQPHDTLYRIVLRHLHRPLDEQLNQEILRLNPWIKDTNIIQSGRRLRLPAAG